MTPPLAPNRDGRSDAAWLAAALLVAVAFRLAFFRGIVSTDDLNYLRHAAELWKGRFDLSSALYLHATRFIVFVPVAGLFALFGAGEAQAVAWPLAASLVTIVLVHRIARRLFDAPTARAAAMLAAILPLMVDESTRLLPGAIIDLFVAIAAWAVVTADDGRRALRLAVAGAAWGAMTMIGELGLLAGGLFPAAIVAFHRRRFRSTAWPIATGFVLAVGLATAIYAVAGGDPLLKARISRVILQEEVAPFRPFYYVNAIVRPFAAHGGVFHLAALGALVGWRRRDRAVGMLAAWALLSWAAMEYASSSLSSYRPLYKFVRYLSLLSVPGVLLGAYGAVAMVAGVRRSRGRGAARVATLALAVVLAAASVRTLRATSAWTDPLRASLARVRQDVRDARPGTIYVTHWLWNTRVGWFTGFDDAYFPSGYHPYRAVDLRTADPASRNRYVQTLVPGEHMDPGILVVDRAYLDASLGRTRDSSLRPGDIPARLEHPPATWRVIDRIDVGGHEVIVYSIPRDATWPSDHPAPPSP